MTGSVNDLLEPILKVAVKDSGGHIHQFETLIDTGFNGYLTLPSNLITAIGLPWLFRQQAELADGSFETFDVHKAIIIWDDALLTVEVEAVDAIPFIGMGVLDGYALRVDVTRGGSVKIESLP